MAQLPTDRDRRIAKAAYDQAVLSDGAESPQFLLDRTFPAHLAEKTWERQTAKVQEHWINITRAAVQEFLTLSKAAVVVGVTPTVVEGEQKEVRIKIDNAQIAALADAIFEAIATYAKQEEVRRETVFAAAITTLADISEGDSSSLEGLEFGRAFLSQHGEEYFRARINHLIQKRGRH